MVYLDNIGKLTLHYYDIIHKHINDREDAFKKTTCLQCGGESISIHYANRHQLERMIDLSKLKIEVFNRTTKPFVKLPTGETYILNHEVYPVTAQATATDDTFFPAGTVISASYYDESNANEFLANVIIHLFGEEMISFQICPNTHLWMTRRPKSYIGDRWYVFLKDKPWYYPVR